jgi:hypothetical protein
MPHKYQLFLVLPLAMLMIFAACAGAKSNNALSETTQAKPSPTPLQLTVADLTKLRWIEGSWRGTGGGVPTFYERYKFENDSTLRVETLTDETLSKVSDEGRFELKEGHFGKSEGESGAVATAFDGNSITFSPLGKARNTFRFQRESDNAWKAILSWTGSDGTPKERV